MGTIVLTLALTCLYCWAKYRLEERRKTKLYLARLAQRPRPGRSEMVVQDVLTGRRDRFKEWRLIHRQRPDDIHAN